MTIWRVYGKSSGKQASLFIGTVLASDANEAMQRARDGKWEAQIAPEGERELPEEFFVMY